MQCAPGSFPALEWPGHEVDHSSLSGTEDTNKWSYTSTPPIRMVSWYGQGQLNRFTYFRLTKFSDVFGHFGNCDSFDAMQFVISLGAKQWDVQKGI